MAEYGLKKKLAYNVAYGYQASERHRQLNAHSEIFIKLHYICAIAKQTLFEKRVRHDFLYIYIVYTHTVVFVFEKYSMNMDAISVEDTFRECIISLIKTLA